MRWYEVIVIGLGMGLLPYLCLVVVMIMNFMIEDYVDYIRQRRSEN